MCYTIRSSHEASTCMQFSTLSSDEKRVIEEKGTEAPFSGEYYQFSAEGIYFCRRCGAPLYRSEDKFDAHCGWPAFDDEIPGAVRRTLDADGRRTEIACVRCGAHLGHVFKGEHLTKKDTRHCVNSLSMRFVPQDLTARLVAEKEVAYFGGGCFWCTEAAFKRVKGVLLVTPGYAGGLSDKDNTIECPSYEMVLSGTTGHAEVVRVEYDPTRVSYEALLGVFFMVHNPTTLNRQGNDIGSQYRSIILCVNEVQQEITEQFVKDLEESGVFDQPIVTQIVALDIFYPAEEYHQNYFSKHTEAAYCQTVINPKLAKLRKIFGNIFTEE